MFFARGEKGDAPAPDIGVPVWAAGEDPMATLARAIGDAAPAVVLDLSDEPVLGYRERMELVAVALVHGVPYVGSDFRFEPPEQSPPIAEPTLAVIGTGKRAGKTAIAGALARLADRRGLRPIVVAMGRGGPADPQIAEAGSVDLSHLLELVARGEAPYWMRPSSASSAPVMATPTATAIPTPTAMAMAPRRPTPTTPFMAFCTSVSSGDSVNMITIDSTNSTMFAIPIGRNISRLCTRPTSVFARDTS